MVLNAAVISQQGAPGYPIGNIWYPGGWSSSGNQQTFAIRSNPSSSLLYLQPGITTNPTVNSGRPLGYIPGYSLLTTSYSYTETPPCPISGVVLGGGLTTGGNGSYQSSAQMEIPYMFNVIPNIWMGPTPMTVILR